MASYKSRFNPPRREDQPPYTHVPTTRLPQRSVTPTLQSGHSKLQKRNPNRDDQPHSSSRANSSVRSRQERTVPMPQPTSRPSLSKTPLQKSSSRLPKLEVPRAVITPTPSLVSGSSVSTSDSPRSSVLRKKQSSLGARPRRDDSLPSYEGRQMIKEPFSSFKDPFSETVLGISIPQTSNTPVPLQVDTEYAYNYEPGPTDMAPPSFSHYAPSTTPSTGYSASPGLFSVSSTPNSMSSYSPGVTLPSKPATRMRQASPLSGKPPGARLATPELSSSRGPTPSSSGVQVERQKARQGNERMPTARRPSGSATEKPHVQAPPELAHLADSPATSRRPSRPSREGTSEIVGFRGPSPVIQSNMSSFPSSHRRTPSTESATGVPNSRARFGIPSKSSSRNPSPNPSLVSASNAPIRGNTPNVEKERSQTLPTKSSRFGFFTRRTKTEPSTAKPEKKHRRGPAAGTGHEGYGRYAFRGRSGSTGSVTPSIGHSASAATTSESLTRTPSTRKSSVTSTSSTDMDDFFLNRLAPRVIRGNGSSDGLTRSPEPMESTSSLNVSSPPVEHQKKAEVEVNRPSLLPSAMSGPVRSLSPTKKPAIGSRRPSESDDDTKRSFIPSLTSKRTSRMSKVIEPKPTPRAPRSGSALGKGRKGSVDDYTSDGKEGNWLKASKKETEVSKPRKWNFFQRAHAGPRAATPAVEAAAAVPASRSVAHYALASEAGIDLEDIEQLMEEDSSPESESITLETHQETTEVKERLQSMLLPPKPVLPAEFAMPARPASPKVSLRGESDSETQRPEISVTTSAAHAVSESHDLGDLTPVTDLSPCSSPSRPSSPVESVVSPKTTLGPLPVFAPKMASPLELPQIYSPPPGPPPSSPPPKPSRLAQVGRIPQVVSRRNQPHRPAQSFSRPFAANQPHPSLPSPTSFDATSYYAEPYPVLQGLNALSHASAIATLSPTAEEAHRQSEFFKFPQRKDSEVSYSSSSGTWSFLPTAGTAIVPPTGAPQSEDEVWNEYDDLIDEVLSPSESDAKLKPRSSLEPLPLNIKTDSSHPSYHLRRSRLLSVLHAQSPTSPVSLSEFLQGYGEKTISVVDPVTGRLSFPSARMSTGSAPRNNRASSTRSSLPASLTLSARPSKATLTSSSEKDRDSASTNKYRDTKLKELTEADGTGLVSMANLRFGALMTSKWLSFGRVLFSPAHFELKNPSEDSVLVIDGLGKDWSYYCALTYPEATVYNLGPGASVSPQSSSSCSNTANEPWSTLANHRHISHPSPKTAFPFPKGFFACVVLRFPSGLPSSTHRFVISECKRVLRPGGHLELSVLDLDLVNMGNRARRAVRGLKVKMQVADENTSLRNMSDEIMGVLGRKGFVECNRCFVGVPVAGGLPSPSSSSEDNASTKSRSRKGSVASSSTPASRKQSSAAKPTTTSTAAPKQELSFTELLNLTSSPTPSASTSTSIADMVARVGRWWYSRCYESVVLPEAGSSSATENSGQMLETSLWNDEALVRECEKRGTSFRLLIGFATKPECGVRRTVSV